MLQDAILRVIFVSFDHLGTRTLSIFVIRVTINHGVRFDGTGLGFPKEGQEGRANLRGGVASTDCRRASNQSTGRTLNDGYCAIGIQVKLIYIILHSKALACRSEGAYCQCAILHEFTQRDGRHIQLRTDIKRAAAPVRHDRP